MATFNQNIPSTSRIRRLFTIGSLVLVLAAIPVFWMFAGRWLAPAATDAALQSGVTETSSVDRARQLLAVLQRDGYGPGGEAIEAIYAPPDYFRLTEQSATAEELRAADRVIFLLTENVHYGDLPAPLKPILRLDDNLQFLPVEATVMMDAVHHRTTLVAFDRRNVFGNEKAGTPHMMELVFPGVKPGQQTVMTWPIPIGIEAPVVTDTPENPFAGLTIGSMLALMGGLLASMWPCLFQLTVYFIPSLAGISMQEADQPSSVMRRKVLQTAIFFVIGIVTVYTLAGGIVGYLAGNLHATDIFETYRHPVSIVAGILIIGMALRMAVRARAPMVCHMPVVRLAGRGQQGPIGTMLLGLAFATGCMTCFGAALGIGMLTYTVTTGSWLTGAVTLFLFSLGIAVPLVAAAAAMAQVLPLLGKLERIAPWMTLASSVVMIGFALLLITDNYHVVSDSIAAALSLPKA